MLALRAGAAHQDKGTIFSPFGSHSSPGVRLKPAPNCSQQSMVTFLQIRHIYKAWNWQNFNNCCEDTQG